MRTSVPNPSEPSGRKPVHLLTDRAMRYRANSPDLRPPGPKICAFCGSRRNVEVHHVDGREENLRRENLCWACRSCNTKLGVVMNRAGLGRRTRQFNPPSAGARNLAQWMIAVLSAKGESDEMSVPEAVAMIRATSPEKRSQFAEEIWRRRRARGTDRRVPF